MEQVVEFLSKMGQSAVASLRVRSALNPILWLNAVVLPASLSGAYLLKDDPILRYICVGLAALVIVVACAGYAYFAIVKPEKLQSEDYQIRHETLQIIQQSGSPVRLDSTSLQAIANPVITALPERREGHEE